MAEYKNILTGYVNERKEGDGHYLVISNVSEEDVVIKAGEKVYLNRTPVEILSKHPKVPHYSKSLKIEEEATSEEFDSEQVADEIPF